MLDFYMWRTAMSENTTLNIIKETEAKAAGLRTQAQEDSRSLILAAQRDAERRFDVTCGLLAQEKKDALARAEADADAMIEEHRKDAVFEAERLKNRALRYGEEAVKYIRTELEKKCQL